MGMSEMIWDAGWLCVSAHTTDSNHLNSDLTHARTLRIVTLGAFGSTLLLCRSATEQHEETDDEGTSKGESLAIGQEVCEFSNGTAAESKKD